MLRNAFDTDSENLDKLIHSIAGGDRGALAELYKLTNKSVYGFALSVLKNPFDAQDVLQDCYLHIFSAAGGYRKMGKPMAWILTITRNLCLKSIRSQANRIPLSEEGDIFRQEEFSGSADDRITLLACMKSLGDEERQIVVLHAVSGLKHREIASLLQIPLSTALSKYNRAVKKLKKALEEGAAL